MKNFFYIIIITILFSCNSENANDCFQTSGPIVRQVVDTPSFERILVNRGVRLVLKQDIEFSIVIEAGENLINDVSASVRENELVLSDGNTCNFVRDYAPSTVYVSAPNITAIRSSTQYEVVSDGALTFESLALISEDFFEPDANNVGDFRLQLANKELRVSSNNISSFFISGTVDELNINFSAGSGRFESENLIAQDVQIFHRGSNDIIVNPQQSIKGQILSTGDVIALNQPPIVEVEELFNGRLIFQD